MAKTMEYKTYSYNGTNINKTKKSPTYQVFKNTYRTGACDGRLPALVSVFAQDSSAAFSDNSFEKEIKAEINALKTKTLKSTPIHFIFELDDSNAFHSASEKKIANFLRSSGEHVITISRTADPNLQNHICSSEPVDFILDSSLIMFAFWDGQRSPDGSSRVEQAVVKMLKGQRNDTSNKNGYEMKFPCDGVITHFVIDCKNSFNIADFEKRYLYTHFAENGTEWYYISAESAKTKRSDFGDKKSNAKKKVFERQAKSLSALNSSLESFKISPSDTVDDILPLAYAENKRINDARFHFAFFDKFAIFNQNKRKKQSQWLIAIAVLALVSFEIFADFCSWWGFLLAYAVLFVIAFLIYNHSKKSRAHENYILGRVLSESLRSQGYWYALGIDKSVRDTYPVAHRSELGWLYVSINALHAVNSSVGGPIGSADNKNLYEHVKSLWIGKEDYDDNKRQAYIYQTGQYHYFDSSSKAKAAKSRRFDTITKIVSVVIVALTIGLVALICGSHLIDAFSLNESITEQASSFLLFLLGLFPIAIAAVSMISSLLLYKDEAERHCWSKMLVKKVLTDLENNTDYNVQTQIFESFAKHVIDENGDWALMKLEHRPEIIS